MLCYIRTFKQNVILIFQAVVITKVAEPVRSIQAFISSKVVNKYTVQPYCPNDSHCT